MRMRINEKRIWAALTDEMDSAVAAGVRRAFKYADAPTQDSLIEQVSNEVGNTLADWISLDEDEEDPHE